ncbi:fungal specific transcription factor [Blastomyces dermatitidis ATCC 18188]|uniref:C6 finger domain transcription factor nscR n=1 Tax=Ajellomyces dermatitidis (strain ATCC 18188 / CBS 674.68) TaxID=653446 RepID=F2TBM5_AJEDA|nr:fungal specific transcription factor [Blastomyces dermatitidis ATCC 18188]
MVNLNLSSTAAPPSDDAPPRKPPHRRRERLQLSCTTCRQKKLKCDRNLPCENCATRGRGDTCVYANPPPQGQTRAAHRPVNRATMQGRVRHLEKMVLSLVRDRSPSCQSWSTVSEFRPDWDARDHHLGYRFENYTSGSTGPGSRECSAMPMLESIESAPRLGLPRGGDSRYFDSGHWASILADIGELKGYFAGQGEGEPPETTASESGYCETDLLSGRFGRLTQMEILDRVPPKPLVDYLIARYLSSDAHSLIIIHRPSFRKQYDLFWQDPWSTPITWVSGLFSMMCSAVCIAMHSGERMPESFLEPAHQMDQYRQMAVHCLFTGNYATGPPHAVEALILYFFTEYTRNPDMQLPCWLLFGVILRIAMRKGYHRDPRHHPSLSVFEGEMRRRSWTVLFHMDLLTSIDAGLPRMIQPAQMDVELPRCILDDDIDEDAVELPPSRPDLANPRLAYTIAKRPLVIVFGSIVDLNNAKELASYEEILKLDKALQDSYGVIPTVSKPDPTTLPVAETPDLIMRRLILDLIYQKGRYMLHRKYYTISWNNPQYTYSRQTCIEAAMTTLRQQAFLHQESQPGGILHRLSWIRMSLVAHESLLAAMILCLYLDRLNRQGVGVASDVIVDSVTPERRSEMLQLLESAYAILSVSAASSIGAARACGVMNIILQKVGLMLPMPNGIMNEVVGVEQTNPMTSLGARSYPGSESLTGVPTVHIFYPDGVYPQATSVPMPIPISEMDLADPEAMFFSPETMTIQNFIQFPQEIDWNLWDNFFRPHDWAYSFDMAQMGQ